MPWYAIRNVYLFGRKADANVFEERIVAFEAATWEQAYARAREEAAQYATANGFEVHSEQVGYEQDGTPLVDGYELWSELFESELALEAFYEARYGRFGYQPPP
jgi:hypothetical protein